MTFWEYENLDLKGCAHCRQPPNRGGLQKEGCMAWKTFCTMGKTSVLWGKLSLLSGCAHAADPWSLTRNLAQNREAGGLRPPAPPCFSGGLRPPGPPKRRSAPLPAAVVRILATEPLVRGRTFFQKSDFLKKPLVPGSFAAWGRFFPRKSISFEEGTRPRQLRCLGQNFCSSISCF